MEITPVLQPSFSDRKDEETTWHGDGCGGYVVAKSGDSGKEGLAEIANRCGVHDENKKDENLSDAPII